MTDIPVVDSLGRTLCAHPRATALLVIGLVIIILFILLHDALESK